MNYCWLLQVDKEALEGLKADIAEYRRTLQRAIIDTCKPLPQPEEGSVAPEPAAKGKGKGAEPPAAVIPNFMPKEPIFAPELNDEWRALSGRLMEILAPLMRSLLRALPPVAAADPDQPPPAPAKGAPPAAPADGRHKLCLLVDPQLAGLPWESLPHLQVSGRNMCELRNLCLARDQLTHLGYKYHFRTQWFTCC